MKEKALYKSWLQIFSKINNKIKIKIKIKVNISNGKSLCITIDVMHRLFPVNYCF